jgi:CRP-like cAMP-binding protein
MYLLLEGEVGLLRGKRSIDVVKPGEIFGEMAAITQQPRSASAIAKSACRVIALDAKQFQRAIQKTPQFVLMLMSIMINRLRLADAMAGMTRSLPDWAGKDETRMFDDALMHELLDALPERPPQRFTAAQTIMKRAKAAYSCTSCCAATSRYRSKSTVVERVGPGGCVRRDGAGRSISARRERDCGRQLLAACDQSQRSAGAGQGQARFRGLVAEGGRGAAEAHDVKSNVVVRGSCVVVRASWTPSPP